MARLHERVIAHATSSQSHLIVGAILLAFIVWSTLRGTLGGYLADLGFGKKPPQAAAAVGGGGPIGGGAAGGAIGGGVGTGIFQNLPQLPSLPGSLPPFNPNAPAPGT